MHVFVEDSDLCKMEYPALVWVPDIFLRNLFRDTWERKRFFASAEAGGIL